MSPLRFAFSTLAFASETLETAVSSGRAWGYEGVELRLIDGEVIDPRMGLADRQRVKRVVDGASIPVICVDTSVRLTEDGSGAEIARFLELANAWGSPMIRVFGGPLAIGGQDRQARLASAARILEAPVPLGERLGVAIGIETHDGFSTSSVLAELLALVPAPIVGAVWDSHHPYRMGELPAETYENVGARLQLAQVKDAICMSSKEGGWQLVLLGEGEVPVHAMLDLLEDRGYEGWVSVEWEKRWHPEIEEPAIALPQHLELLRQWASSPEAP